MDKYRPDGYDQEIMKFYGITLYADDHSGIITACERGSNMYVMFGRAEAIAAAKAILDWARGGVNDHHKRYG